ncbi:hypothetical protein Tsubulata_021779 [Turnera subulata]|uniref:Uncharacterized protein n=1 Tax=Turnera subulata TaxID=218843 RepID=A0A9Q0FAG9_9ROSI|nr:hypothetical protein Tsubulata_021779 [Turnera subulata]
MAVSLNSVVALYTTSQGKYRHVSGSFVKASTKDFATSLSMFGSKVKIKERRTSPCLSVADSDNLAAEASDKGPGGAASVISDNPQSAGNPSSVDALGGNGQPQTRASGEAGQQMPSSSNGSTVSSDQKEDSRPKLQFKQKKAPLTAKERLKAARVLSRYNEAKSKAPKKELGSNVLALLRESEKGKKKTRLPEAPTDMFDDSNRGSPKPGLTFDFPGGTDLLIIAVSFVLISTIMLGTTYIVWKVGAIHFNEY